MSRTHIVIRRIAKDVYKILTTRLHVSPETPVAQHMHDVSAPGNGAFALQRLTEPSLAFSQ
jgi:hypothetical protein